MNVLFLTSAHNSLSQRLLIELTERGHLTHVRVVATSQAMIDAVSQKAPDLIIAPMLKTAIPKEVWAKHTCLIVHPGVKGDRGASSLDWAIMTGQKIWGVTVLQAGDEMDAGPIWASYNFSMPATPTPKSSLYRQQVTEAAVHGVLEAVEKFQTGRFQPEPLDYSRPDVLGSLKPNMRQSDRGIDWDRDDTATIARKVRAADSAPGVLSSLAGVSCFLYGAHEEDEIKGAPGEILAKRDGAVCVGTVDGAVWISHLRAKSESNAHRQSCHLSQAGAPCDRCDAEVCRVSGIKLPATEVLAPLLSNVPEASLPIDTPADRRTFREIVYREEGEVGFLSFDFYNGAMSTGQCARLREAFLHARSRPTKVIVLLGGQDFWSNGIHLNVIEANVDPAKESWRNINAMNDLVREIISDTSHFVIAGLRGNAGAGGAILALAADRVYARSGIVLNPHYRGMGELYGSEYWTYLLPKRVGQALALDLTQSCNPMGTKQACEIGFLDDAFGSGVEAFETELSRRAHRIAQDSRYWSMLRKKKDCRFTDEQEKPLSRYRTEELERMRVNFFGPDPAYHEARRRFVFKGRPPARDTRHLAPKIRFPGFVYVGEDGRKLSGGWLLSPRRSGFGELTRAELGSRLAKLLRDTMEALPFR